MITFKADRTVGCVPVFEFSGYWFTETENAGKTPQNSKILSTRC